MASEHLAEQTAQGKSGGELVVDALDAYGVERVFGVPGESCLPVFEALRTRPDIQLVVCRHEANAAHMAEADARMRGGPGVCIVSRGPGAMHAAIGVHMAWQSATPLVLLIGQVETGFRGRRAFQEMNYEQVFGSTAKLVLEIDRTDRIPELMARALHVAVSGCPGPVVVSLPEDVLAQFCTMAARPRQPVTATAPTERSMERLHTMLAAAQRPLVIVGGPGWDRQAAQDIMAFARTNELPVASGWRAHDVVDNRDDCYVGTLGFGTNPALAACVREADLLLVVGDPLGEPTTRNYGLLRPEDPPRGLVHVHPDADEPGRVFATDLPIHADVAEFAQAARALPPIGNPPWRGLRASQRAAFDAFRRPLNGDRRLDLSRVVHMLRERLADDAVITYGAGNYTGWISRFFEFRQPGTQLAPVGGAMGYGLPAGIAAKLRHPEREVVVVAGDGCFMMASPDFVTAVRHGLGIVVLVVNNAMYGAIRMHQEKQFPDAPFGTDLVNPDFAAWARSFGAFGEVVDETGQFPEVLSRALQAGGPAVIELRVDPEEVSPGLTLAALRRR